jgi:hypothetical protein
MVVVLAWAFVWLIVGFVLTAVLDHVYDEDFGAALGVIAAVILWPYVLVCVLVTEFQARRFRRLSRRRDEFANALMSAGVSYIAARGFAATYLK